MGIDLKTAENALFILAALVPGYIWFSTLAKAFPQKKAEDKLFRLLKFLVLTAWNHLLFSPLIYALVTQQWFAERPWLAWLGWAVVLIIGPLALAKGLARAHGRRWGRVALTALGFDPVLDLPTAWQYAFMANQACYVLVTLADGAQVAGVFGGASAASDDMSAQDLYLEEVLELNERGQWGRLTPRRGMLITKGHVKMVEFIQT